MLTIILKGTGHDGPGRLLHAGDTGDPIAQRAMGYADTDPTPVPPGRPNRDTAATYEEAKSERIR